MLKKMRQCRLNFADNRYDCEAGIIGEHYATELIVTPPAIMPTEAVYCLCFEPGGLSEIILQTTDGAFSYPLPSAVTATPYCCVTLIGYVGSEQIYKSRMVRLHFSQTADGDADIDPQQPGIIAEVNRNTAARHSHDNKAVLDKFAESDGQPTYDGQALGGGAGDFIIKMTVASDDDGKYTVASCSTTVEQIDAAVADEKRVVVIATDTDNNLSWDIPIVQGFNGSNYYFATFLLGQAIISFVQKVGENQARWQFIVGQIGADFISYSNDALPNMSTVGEALDELVKKSGHTHTNKDVLDKLSDSNGKLQYNGSDISVTKNGVISALGYTPQAVSTKVSTGSNIALADNTEYRLTDVTILTLTYPTGNFECWMRLNFAASGDITVTLPAGTGYIGTAPDFHNGETWELSFKDKILAAQKVGDGT